MVTMTPITMTGVFVPLADEFIEFKRAQGYKYYSEAKVLSRFCRFTRQYNLAKPAWGLFGGGVGEGALARYGDGVAEALAAVSPAVS